MEVEKLKAIEEAEQERDAVPEQQDNETLVRASSSSLPATSSAASQTRRNAGTWPILRRFPLLLVAPSLLLVVMIALCVFGVTHATHNRIDTQHELAQAAARDTADALRLQLSVVSGAALTLATFVVRDPNWSQLEEDFIPVSKEIFRQANQTSSYELAELLYAPFGKIAANYAPPENHRGPVRTDLFAPENVERTEPYATVQLGSMTINGPLPLTVGGRMAILARYPVFIKNVSRDEDWNNPFNQTGPTGCDELCYDEETNTKFWGFTAAFFYADSLLSGTDERLRQLVEEGYEYRLTKDSDINAPRAHEGQEVLVKSSGWDHVEPTAVVDVRVPGAAWFLAVYTPEIDAIEDMRDGLIAMIVIVSFLLSGLLLMLLVSNKQASLLLEEQLVTNTALEKANDHLTHTKRVLEEEKLQREALLGRQFDLISCFERKDSRLSPGASGKLSPSVADKQLATLEQIAALRRAMDEEKRQHVFSPSDDIRFFELLGEGTFGKVHRGTWRSTEVAIKTIVLPANMSGAEKREKMVVWEAAISSSLTHPNIVQTYTYSIKPVREQDKFSTGQRSFADSVSGLGSAVQICGETERDSSKQGNTQQGSSDKSSDGGAIHSFEVSLVLEYCDRGCLRGALDQGAFMTAGGLNYPAILDTAADIARAMLHLHCNNVLHMDLKARNILLASSGSEGRGVTCKVSDFGLAVRMEQAETHMSGCFQGTLTHMAPETLLKGQVSKAADVYAYGVVLWELFTGGQPYKGIPKALLGHKIVAEHCRPPLPFVMPQGYKALVQACWAKNPDKRLNFAEILERLQSMRDDLPPTEPLGNITPPLPKGPTLVSASKLRPGSLLPVTENSKSRQQSGASAITFDKVGSAEHPSTHSMKGAQHPSPPLRRSAEEQRRSASHLTSGSLEQAGTSQGRKSPHISSPHSSMPNVREMVTILSSSLRERSGVPEVHGHRSSGGFQGSSDPGQGSSAQREGDADGLGSGKRVEAGRNLMRRSSSLPNIGQEDERGVPEQLSSSGMFPPGSGSHLFGSQQGAENVSSRQGAGLLDGTQVGSNDTWLPFAPQQLNGREAESQPVAEARQPTPDNAKDGMEMPSPHAHTQGRSINTSVGAPPTSWGHHQHSSMPPSHRPSQGDAASTSSRWKPKPSRNRGNSHCVMVIGGDDEGSYPENSFREGSSQATGRVELSSIRTRAVLGNMLDPIGETSEDNQEGEP